MLFHHMETQIRTFYPGLQAITWLASWGLYLPSSSMSLIPLYSCSSLSVSQKPQGCPCLLSLVLVSSSAWMSFFCMFMRLPPSYQAGLWLNVTSFKRPFLIPSLKQLLSCPLLHHPAHFLHGTHYSLTLLSVYLV